MTKLKLEKATHRRINVFKKVSACAHTHTRWDLCRRYGVRALSERDWVAVSPLGEKNESLMQQSSCHGSDCWLTRTVTTYYLVCNCYHTLENLRHTITFYDILKLLRHTWPFTTSWDNPYFKFYNILEYRRSSVRGVTLKTSNFATQLLLLLFLFF